MTKEELAGKLNGKEYREDISEEIIKEAVDSGLVIIYGHSDDLMEVDGAIYDEGGCYRGADFFIDREGLLPDRESIEEDDELESWLKRKKTAKKISAIRCAKDEPRWTYRTSIPHATFNVMEDDEVQCRGIVFELAELN